MIKLYAFGNVHPIVKGYTRDLRIFWALEELGLPYEVHGLDHSAGETTAAAFSKISPFNQIPIIDDDGFILSESAAIVLYLAEKAGKLIPSDSHGRTRVNQWCFASLTTIETPLVLLLNIDKFGDDKSRRDQLLPWIDRVLGGVENQLLKHEWIAGTEFSVADILLATVLRIIRHTEILNSYPKTKVFYERALARPAWQKTMKDYALRLNTTVEAIK